jgi:hypothetical protein
MKMNWGKLGGRMTPIEFLKAELSAIDRLNCVYWQTEDADRYEKLAYLVRERKEAF